jgi:hypothetical protein
MRPATLSHGVFGDAHPVRDVRYWHKADILNCTAHVRYWG